MPISRNRRSIRLKYHDYAQPGGYFVTLCTQGRACILGQIVAGEMFLSEWGVVAHQCWRAIPQHYPYVILDDWIIMPNHLHGIIIIGDSVMQMPDTVPRHFGQSTTGTLATMLGTFKAAVTRRVNQQRDTPITPFWQRNYYETVIRDETHLNQVRRYIQANPACWQEDSYYNA